MKKTKAVTKNIKSEQSKRKKRSKNIPRKKTNAKISQPAQKKASKEDDFFPIVAIGASAGGIEAISSLLENLSPKLGMGYVVIQHLAPNHESILPELLERKTKMPVQQAVDAMHIKRDTVYVIPPNTYIAIEDSRLKLSPRIKTEGSYHSIDFFLDSLAATYKHKAIAIILSGTATDGTVGIQSIKAEGGVTFAQDATAKFSGMPKSAIDSGFIDFILSPAAIAKQLQALPKIIYSLSGANKESPLNLNDSELKKIYFLLHNKHRVDFAHYKPSTINRRILRRMVLNRVTETEDYIKLLQQNTDEVDLLYKDLLINVTSFFRDKASYTMLTKKVFPALLKGRKSNDPIRIWVPACSSGEEAYSTAISLFEFLKEKALTTPIQVFATDISESAIDRARTGLYPKGAVQNISAPRLKKYFVKIDGSYQITKAVRDVCIFAAHNLLNDPPFSRMDLVSCQNVLIYLEAGPQKKILQAFHYALKPAGYLLLGKSETIGNSSDLFTQVGREQKLYTKKNTDVFSAYDFSLRSYYPSGNIKRNKKIPAGPTTDVSIDKEMEKVLLSRYTPASVLVDKDLNIQRFTGATSQFLQPVSGKASLHLLKMIRDELIFDLRSLIHRAKKDNRAVKKEGITISDNGHSKELNLEVIPVKSSGDTYYLIVFKDPKKNSAPLQQGENGKKNRKDGKTNTVSMLERQLNEAREQMKIMSEEFEATREELQSSNEEVLSSNEELQSINEEIETSKEELQSANEELNTINEELERRNRELKEAADYSQAIVQTIDEPLVILNTDMRIRMANRAFYKNFKTSSDEVEGMNFFEISNYQWDIPELRKNMAEVFSQDKNFEQFELQHVFSLMGEKILRLSAARINKGEAKKDWVLLVIEDITQRKKAELQLKNSEERFRLLVQNASDIITILTPEGTILYESEPVEKILGYTTQERVGKNILKDTIVHPDDLKIKANAFKQAVSNKDTPVKTEFRLKHKNGTYRDIEAVYLNMLDDIRIQGVVGNYHDITEQRKLENQREEFVSIASHELKTPVTSLKGYVQIIQDMLSPSEDGLATELLQKLNLQVDRLTSLIKDLFDITKMKEGRMDFKMSNFNIDELISEMVNDIQLASKKHIIVADLQAKETITADRERIGQALRNLLSNAVKYSPDSDKVIVTSSSDEEKITVYVQDFGIGIDPREHQKLFTRFFRSSADAVPRNAGLGLGLYIASEIIKHHNGTITVSSEKNKGSVFSFTLPLNQSA